MSSLPVQDTKGKSKLIQLLARLDGKMPKGIQEYINRWKRIVLLSRAHPSELSVLQLDLPQSVSSF